MQGGLGSFINSFTIAFQGVEAETVTEIHERLHISQRPVTIMRDERNSDPNSERMLRVTEMPDRLYFGRESLTLL